MLRSSVPPQTIISLPVHTAVCRYRPVGRIGRAGSCPTVRAGIVSARRCSNMLRPFIRPRRSSRCRSRLPCESRGSGRIGGAGGGPTVGAGIVSPAGVQRLPPIRSAPDDHLAAGPHCRVLVSALGALVVLVAVQLSVLGLYLPPVFNIASVVSAPDDHFAASPHRRMNHVAPPGALVVLVAVQLSVAGSYLPPVFRLPLPLYPPQTIISLPVQTAVWPARHRARWWCWWLSNCRCLGCTRRRCSDR